ncbi:MAG: hypothetical protein A4E25_00132 [Methanobacterium sp. PtaB.Bin024]|nr:MAG: hypothetical protein A4E25_00132 [Methanobacterium sp. PtaB.Bin024]
MENPLLTDIIIGLLMYKGDYNKNHNHAVGALILVLVLMWIVICIIISQGYTLSLITSGILTTIASACITYFELKKWEKSQQKELEKLDNNI